MIFNIWPATFFFLIWLCNDVTSKRNHTLKPRVVLPENYVKEMRPPSRKGQPVVVEFSIYVVDVNSINVEDMDFRVDMFIRQTWVESRLQLPEDIFEEGDDHVTLPPEFFDNLWHPDPYFLNSKVTEIAELTHKFSSVTLYRNQTVRYAARMHAIIACQMEFQLYPMDIQSCPIYIESFSYSNQKVRFQWSEAGVTINPELKLLQYHIGEPLRLEETNGYMIDKDDLWMAGCMMFVFAALAEFVVVKVLDKQYQMNKSKTQESIPRIIPVRLNGEKGSCGTVAAWEGSGVRCRKVDLTSPTSPPATTPVVHPAPGAPTAHMVGVERRQSILQVAWVDADTGQERVLWREIDKLSRVVFPALFLLFVTMYWPVLLLKTKASS
ncbi:jg7578 [Pararge aegeria aegeria]|uniref:Jg7578 protein n=1 Tax=Pararge aegeria aegeria TaxID=348720 RepID=A0A8S4S7P5_9NEOP|nr:jg7578 [Pararge aegeria aegeria]